MKTILIVEDEASVRDNLEDILELEAFRTLAADNGATGLELARKERPDLIICDVMMPELDGFGVLAALQADPATAEIPFIFLTARADRADLRRGMELGADDYLTKPFTPDELRRAIAVRLSKHARLAGLPPGSEAIADALDAALDRQAAGQNEFQLYYQPQISLADGGICGAEALLRWHSPDLGRVSPGQFIPVAEATGAIGRLGTWVLQETCRQIRRWRDAPPGGGDRWDFPVAANVSARQFAQPGFAGAVADLVRGFDLEPAALEIELTESSLLQDREAAIATLAALRSAGFKISIDDFGTGYSSLQYLQQFPFDTLKIDRCFVAGIDAHPDNAAIAGAIVRMARELHLRTIAEGVETPGELAWLAAQRCDAIQGYLFSPPVPAEAFAALVADDRRLALPSRAE